MRASERQKYRRQRASCPGAVEGKSAPSWRWYAGFANALACLSTYDQMETVFCLTLFGRVVRSRSQSPRKVPNKPEKAWLARLEKESSKRPCETAIGPRHHRPRGAVRWAKPRRALIPV